MISLERRLVASVLKSRSAAETIFKHVSTDVLNAYSKLLFDVAKEYYETDKTSTNLDIEHISDKVALKIDNPNKRDLYVGYARECLAIDISPANVAGIIEETRRKQSAASLAQALANSDPNDASLIAKIDEHRDLLSSIDRGEGGTDQELLHNVSVKQINEEVLNKKGLIKILSQKFTEEIGGGIMRGDNILLLARPEMGKTALALSIARSIVRQKLKVLYFGNEEPVRRTIERFQGCLSGLSRLDRLRDPDAADEILKINGYEHIYFRQLTPGSTTEIDEICHEEEPAVVIVDQLRHLKCRAENRTNQLEIISTDLRNTGNRRNCAMIQVTQAGDSATDKLVLEMGDIDSSNTGIPGAMDLIVGLGSNKEYEAINQRMISFCKNKLSGRHVHFPMKIDTQLSRLEDI